MSSESGIWAGSSDLQEFRPRVFITNAFGARNLVKLKEKGITHVLVTNLNCFVLPHSQNLNR